MRLNFKHDKYVYIDIESQSDVELDTYGLEAYLASPNTRIMSVVADIDGEIHAWWNGSEKLAGREEFIWPEKREKQPLHLHSGPSLPAPIAACMDRTFVAHNAWGFDARMWEKLIHPCPEKWYDTIFVARTSGLPAGLDKLGEWLTGSGKDASRNIAKKFFDVSKKPKLGEIFAILRYNIDDVILLKKVHEECLKYRAEEEVILANDRCNRRGVQIDLSLAKSIIDLSEQSVKNAGVEIERITGGEVSADSLRKGSFTSWLRDKGVSLPDLRRETIDKWIEEGQEDIDPVVFQVMQLRKASLRITGAKISRAVDYAHGGRLHNLLVYGGAHTGRFTSRVVQLHNLPRPKIDAAMVLGGELSYSRLADLAAANSITVDDAISSLIRPVIIGNPLSIADYNAIEARCLAGMAGEGWLLDLFRTGGDPYKVIASKLYNVPIAEVTKEQRQVGKVVELGCGYQLGAEKLGMYLANAGVVLKGLTCKEAVKTYREAHPAIRTMWRDLEESALACVRTRSEYHAGGCTFTMRHANLHVTLPSGRDLVYRQAMVEDIEPIYARGTGLLKPTVTYMSPRYSVRVGMYGGKWAENVVQATCRDLMCHALCHDIPAVLHVHDEIVTEGDLDPLMHAMLDAPSWCTFPLKVEGHTEMRYFKEPTGKTVALSRV